MRPRALAAQTIRDDRGETERPEVKDVRFEGVKQLRRDEVAQAVATKESACLGLAFTPFCWISKSPYIYERRYLDRTELARDLVRLLVFYYKHGWRDATVDTVVTRVGENAVRVTFKVTEGAPTIVKTIAVDDPAGQVGRRRRGRGRIVRPQPGEPLDLFRLDSTVVDLRNAYWQRGYGDAQVDRPVIAVDDSADTAAVRLPVQRGRLTYVSRIDVVRTGTRQDVKEETIRRSLFIEPGDLFVRSDIARSQRALYESGLFRSALIDTAVARDAATGRTVCAQQTSTAAGGAAPVRATAGARADAAAGDSSKALVVCVVEGPAREARVAAGFNTADFLQVEGRFTHNYWLGDARRLDITGAVGNLGAAQLYNVFPFSYANPYQGNAAQEAIRQQGRYFAPTYSAGIDLRQRWFGSPRNTLGAGLFVHRRSSPGVFVDRGQGANVAFTRQLSEDVPASGTYRFEISRVEAGDVYFCVNYGVCDDGTIEALRGQQRLSPLALTANINRADDPLFPTRGTLARFEAEHASRISFSDFRYNRVTAEGSTYRRLPFRRSILALRARGGWVDALPGTNAAVGVPSGMDDGGQILHPRKRFYAGGSQSVRGFGENQLGPRVLTVSPDDIRGRRDTTIAGVKQSAYACPAPTSLVDCFAQRRNEIADDRFIPRPLGGTTLLEGNVEVRLPIWRQIWGAVFLDGAMLGERTLRDLGSGTAALTPGVGVRYLSPVGPVRVDMGFRPTLQEPLAVVTQVDDSTGRRLLDLSPDRSCSGEGAPGCRIYPRSGATGIRGFLNRITLHLSIGEAF
ncbi:BamA/OMP85 family outer membrane protein [Roseisolibacter agri]|uniref:Outer membrane protein assembly factor BamA n=1 Tax=Roseisolibacter agri TaxID=2014610 RepID=A0AA37Q669_9BACT|nr:BamA/TamA family outer membrane protein [Roseisolibacter agri]GLC27039.1 hypothetical protein rosag_35520 [Roseisolibacter agri]